MKRNYYLVLLIFLIFFAISFLTNILGSINPDVSDSFCFRLKPIFCLSVLSITDISADVQDEDEWRQLFNGKDLTGWEHTGPGVVFKMQKTNSNSVVFIRVPVEPREEWMPIHYGYEVQIDNMPELSDEDEYHYTGTQI